MVCRIAVHNRRESIAVGVKTPPATARSHQSHVPYANPFVEVLIGGRRGASAQHSQGGVGTTGSAVGGYHPLLVLFAAVFAAVNSGRVYSASRLSSHVLGSGLCPSKKKKTCFFLLVVRPFQGFLLLLLSLLSSQFRA